MKKLFWLFVIPWIENCHVGSERDGAGQVVDCCLTIKEVIANE